MTRRAFTHPAILLPAILGALLAVDAATAANSLTPLSNDPLNNAATLNVDGDGNVLEIVQTHDGLGGGNRIAISLSGDLNGGPLDAAFGPAALSTGLHPGQITQSGHDNTIEINMSGSHNLFAFSQDGSLNSLTGTTIGNNNQVAVSQVGVGNQLAFAQHGNGNVISVVQRSF